MRRKEKQMSEELSLSEVIQKSQVCRLAMSDGQTPYIVPLCFGYRDGALYVHSAAEGRKLDIIRKNSNVCFEFETDVELLQNASPCDWSMRYKCVIGYGQAVFLTDAEEKRQALNIIMQQYSSEGSSGTGSAGACPPDLDATVVIKFTVESISGKKSGWPDPMTPSKEATP